MRLIRARSAALGGSKLPRGEAWACPGRPTTLPRVLELAAPIESPIPPPLALQAASGLPDLAEASGALANTVAEETPKSWQFASMLGKVAAAES